MMATHNEPNTTIFEIVCRIVNSNCKLRRRETDGYWSVDWYTQRGDQVDHYETDWFPTPQWAWKAAFVMLDRRKGERRVEP